MNNKGLTLIELITTFALSAVIIILLINVVSVIRTVYSKSNIKSELYINQSNLSNILNERINRDNIDSYEECSLDGYLICQNFYFVDGENIKLLVSEKEIKFGEYVYKLDKKTSVVNPSFEVGYINTNNDSNVNNILVLKIPIICELYPNIDFGVNVVYLYM